MESPAAHDVTGLLVAWGDGDHAAFDRLAPFVYRELHRLAHGRMRDERPDHVLQTTALIHEAYLRLIDISRVRWQSRAHFYAVAAQVMRRILVDAALEALSQLAPRKGRVVELRYFGGLTDRARVGRKGHDADRIPASRRRPGPVY
jgi:DNA-directed RNA polymerase specialized sigma24 family protein